ncbi:MAG: hypothetical protein C4K58_08260 [Flavobacteriaceae bacterium]|nr:MAG: hypothetical protein C4K58_08260 [Flavobacteriaceae bacterium]
MKKLLLILSCALSTFAVAQNQGSTQKGKILVEANTTVGRFGENKKNAAGQTVDSQGNVTTNPIYDRTYTNADTSINFASNGDQTQYNLGAEVGYFVIDDLAIKVGFGVGQTLVKVTKENQAYTNEGGELEIGDTDHLPYVFSYKLAAKYYILGQFPLEAGFTGITTRDEDDKNVNRAWLGFQLGYAWFITPNVALEPAIRFNTNLSLGNENDKLEEENISTSDRSNLQGVLGFSFFF